MKVLVHYTTQKSIFNYFSKVETVDIEVYEQIVQISEYYNKNSRSQNLLFFIVCYYDLDSCKRDYTVGKIVYKKDTNKYSFTSVNSEICNVVCSILGLYESNTYDNDVYYRVFIIDDNDMMFLNKKDCEDLNKIKLKFFSWEELLTSNELLFNEIVKLVFNKENVLKIASTYKPNLNYSSELLQKKYKDALNTIGFISKDGINIEFKTLHGDIGEFVMHIMLSKFFSEKSKEKYIYPKLVFKSNPKMPIYGNDGTIYLKDKKELYYLEAKFYSNLNQAINKAIGSLKEHNEVSHENISHKIELFRNIKTDMLDEIIEIDEDISENLIIFLMCDSHMKYNEVLKVVSENKNFSDFKKDYNIVLFVLPILSKRDFLNYFQECSKKEREELIGK